MAEYIERETLLLQIDLHGTNKFGMLDEDIREFIKKQPAADVVEVVHGEWVQTKEPLGANEVDCVECSACRESWIIEEGLSLEEYIEFWHYCPNCGAKMDKS